MVDLENTENAPKAKWGGAIEGIDPSSLYIPPHVPNTNALLALAQPTAVANLNAKGMLGKGNVHSV